MGLRYKGQEFESCFFITTTYRDWATMGEVPGFCSAMFDSLHHCSERYGAKVAGFVFMPTHIHMLLFVDGKKLGGFMRDFKKFTAQKVATDLGYEGGIWMPRYDRVAIRTEEVFLTKLDYIHSNPVRSSLVDRAEQWKWSSASRYLSNDGELSDAWDKIFEAD